jgi:hypothetical protein
VLCASDQNFDLIADHSTIQTQDASLISSVTVGGTITASDVVGLNWTIASLIYNIRYTVQGGDTISTIASNLATCINSGGAANCTVTAGFLNALLAFTDANNFGYKPTAAASATVAGKFAFDQPWAASGNSVAAFLSGGATETLTLGANNTLDNGPYMGTSRNVPGRIPVTGDQLGTYYFQGQSAAGSGIDTQYAALVPRVLVQDATNPQGELLLGTSDSGSAKINNPKLYIGNGIAVANSTGTNPGYPGLGNFAVGGSIFALSHATFGSLTAGGSGSVTYTVGGTNISGVLAAAQFAGAAGTTPGIVIGTDNAGNRGLLAGLKYNQSAFNDVGIQTQASAPQFLVKTTGVVSLGAAQPLVWTSTSNDASATVDTGFSRTGAAAVALGNGTQGDFSGSLKLAGLTATGAVVGSGRIVSGTTDTASAADCGGTLHFTSGSAITATLPNSIATLQCTITYIQEGAGQITFSAAAGATIHSFDSFTKTAGQWAVVDIILNTNAGGTSAVYTLTGRGA